MPIEKFLDDAFNYVSIGLEYPYRLSISKDKCVIFQASDKLIIEELPYKASDVVGYGKAIKELYKINNADTNLDDETKDLIDTTN
jgi:hypothetical protein